MAIIRAIKNGNEIRIVEIVVCPKCTASTIKGNFCDQCGATMR